MLPSFSTLTVLYFFKKLKLLNLSTGWGLTIIIEFVCFDKISISLEKRLTSYNYLY